MTKRKIFEELKLSLEDALAYERGQKINLRTIKVPETKPVANDLQRSH
jgi:hypothetical protein